MVNPQFFQDNRRRLMEQVGDGALLIAFSGTPVEATADELYPFVVNRNFYYLTGLTRHNNVLLMTKQDGQVEETLFIEPVSDYAEKWNGKMLTRDEAKAASGVSRVMYVESFSSHMNRLLFGSNLHSVWFDLERRTWDSPPTRVQTFATELRAKHPHVTQSNFYPLVTRLRTVKSPEEIERIREAIRVTGLGIQAMLCQARPEVIEYQLEAHFDFALKMAGCKPGFPSIVGSSTNATVMHYIENNRVVQDGDLVLTDVGAEYALYKADITRTFPVNGRFSSRQKDLYNLVLKALQDTIGMIAPGVEHRKLNETTRRVLADGLKELGVIKEDEELDRYFFYNVSHYLGLDTHDVGPYDELRPGMVLTVEPGVYIPEESIGIRIEDDVLVTNTGCEVLSKDILRTVSEIETFMANQL